MNAPELALDERTALPDDHERATLVGRAWVPGPLAGPSPVLIAKGQSLRSVAGGADFSRAHEQ